MKEKKKVNKYLLRVMKFSFVRYRYHQQHIKSIETERSMYIKHNNLIQQFLVASLEPPL